MIAPMPGHTPVLTTLTFINAKRWFVRDVMVAPLGRDTAMMTAGMAVTRGMDADGDVDEVTGDVTEVTGDDDGAGAEESKGDDDDNTACATDTGHTRGFEVDESAAASASASGTASVAARGITISSQALQDCSDITLLRVTQLCGQSSGTWTPAQWVRARNAGGVHIFGTHITLESCHVFNAAGVYINYHATNATVRNCIIENFSSDAMNIKASNATIEHTIIVGAHKVDGNHNDLCQGWASSNVVFRGNKLIAYRGPPGPLTARDVQGLGAYDGWKKGWIVTDNLVATDHPIGIWLQGDDACIVGNNTVLRCGASLFFASQPTSILVGPSKSGAVKGRSRVFNNLAEAYRLGNSLATAVANQTLKPGARGPRPHWRPSRPLTQAGCLQFRAGYSPMRPGAVLAPASVTQVPGLGLDVAWAPTGYRSTAILLRGAVVAVCRTGATNHFVFTPASFEYAAGTRASKMCKGYQGRCSHPEKCTP